MRPKYLEFVGLNSFQEEAKIDFDTLFTGGLFGVFGKTGAGKSTILDAISYALYGKINRNSSSGDKREINEFINKNCKKMIVRYTFEIQEKTERVQYRVERSRSTSNSTDAVLYRNNLAIAEKQDAVSKKIEEILGLTYTEFNKCIILPQGEFTQFIKQDNKERLELICKLFDLNKYMKLEREVSESYRIILAQKNALEAKQSAYAEYTIEQEKNLQQNIKTQQKEQKKLQTELESYGRELQSLQEEYNNHKKREALLLESKMLPSAEELADMREWLEHIGDVKRVLKEYDALCQEEEKEKEISLKLKENTVNVARTNSVLTELLQNEKEMDFTEQKLVLNTEKAILENIKELQIEIVDLERNTKELEQFKSAREQEYQTIHTKILQLKERIENGNKYLNAMPAAGDYLTEHLGGALLQKEFLENYQYFSKQKKRLEQYNDGSILYQKVGDELAKQIDKYNKKVVQTQENIAADSVIAEYKRRQEDFKKYEKKLEALKIEFANDEKEKSKIENDIQNLQSNIAEKREQINIKTKQRNAKLCGKTIEEQSIVLQKHMDEIVRQERLLQKEIEEKRKQLHTLQAAVQVGETEQKNSVEKIKHLKNSVNALLSSLKYDRIEELHTYAHKYANDKEIHTLLEKVNTNRTLLENLPITHFTKEKEERFLELNSLLQNLQEKKDSLNSSLGANYAHLQNLQKQLQEKKNIADALKNIQEEYQLTESLHTCLQKYKFVHFIANNYLKNICQEANGTLLQLTNNRYYLEYKDAKTGFLIIDNFADGEKRKIHTLSGGESFLVSLSLALALSNTIYQHSLNPIEFFFLDEGFGTLDCELVDTVLDALTQLKKNNFIIGLISHVEELKARIPYQLIVYRDGIKGSKVEIKT